MVEGRGVVGRRGGSRLRVGVVLGGGPVTSSSSTTSTCSTTTSHTSSTTAPLVSIEIILFVCSVGKWASSGSL